MFGFFTRNKSSSETTFVETTAATWFAESTTAAGFIKSTTRFESSLLYCHLNCLVNNCFYVIGDSNTIYLLLRRTLLLSVRYSAFLS